MNITYTKLESEHFLKSIILHIGIVLIAVLIHYLPKWKSNSNNTITIKEAIRVDVVGMPKFSLQELKEMELAEQAAKVEEKAPEVDKNNSDVELKKVGKLDLSNLLKDISKRKVEVKDVKKPKKDNSKIGVRDLKKLVMEGNILSKGTALTGDIKANDNLTEYESYAAQVAPHVRKFWKLPSYLLEADLKCKVKIYIDETGAVLSKNLISSSGNKEFDERALGAIKLASPLPSPKSDILRNVKLNGIVLAFPIL